MLNKLKIIFIILINFQCLYAQKAKPLSKNNLDPLFLFYLLNNKTIYSEEQIAPLDNKELRLLRNLPCAKKGQIFKDTILTKYFSKFGWYKPLYNTLDETQFNQAEKDNIALISIFENAVKIKINDDSSESEFMTMLNGCWQLYTSTVASGYNDRFSFYASDKSFAFYANQMIKKTGLIKYSGWFVIYKDKIEFDISSKTIAKEYLKPPYKSPSSGKQYNIKGVKNVEINLDEAHEFNSVSLSEITLVSIDKPIPIAIGKKFIKIDGNIYWKIFPDNCH